MAAANGRDDGHFHLGVNCQIGWRNCCLTGQWLARDTYRYIVRLNRRIQVAYFGLERFRKQASVGIALEQHRVLRSFDGAQRPPDGGRIDIEAPCARRVLPIRHDRHACPDPLPVRDLPLTLGVSLKYPPRTQHNRLLAPSSIQGAKPSIVPASIRVFTKGTSG